MGSVCIAVGDSVCNTVPEPSGYALAGLALLAAGFAGRSRKGKPSGPGLRL